MEQIGMKVIMPTMPISDPPIAIATMTYSAGSPTELPTTCG